MKAPRLGSVFAIGASLVAAPGVYAVDLTTFSNDNVEARYTANLGTDFGDTIGNGGQGLYDYANTRGNGDPWWRMNDGNPLSNINTYGANDAEDFAGYQFKLPASISEINFSNRIYGDGGTFSSTPRVEVLRNGPVKKGGVWETLPVTWNNAYDSSYIDGHRQYKITPNATTGDVWGVRLIGETSPGPAWEADGWVGVGELQVNGELPIASRYDLHHNLALKQQAIWSYTQWNEPWCLTDGDFTANSYETTWGAGSAGTDFFGVLMDAPHNNVGAIGITFKTFGDGGWFKLDAMKVQYTTDGGATWLDVTGLDMGRYPDDLNYLINTANWAEVAPFLWTFDAVDNVNGIRIIGAPGGTTDGDGFVSALELEVFTAVPEPASLALLTLGGLALARRRRR